MVKKDSGSTVSKKESKKEDTNKKTKKKTSASSKKQQSKENSKVETKEVELEADSVPVEDQELSSDNSSSSLEDRKKQAAKNFSVTVSFSLYSKLLSQAEEEGISLDEYAGELLSEGCVVRAWDIQSLNYNSSFKGVNAGGGYRPNPNMGNGSNFRMNKKSKKGMSHARYQNIMNDKSAFMEYVRRSDKEKRR